MSIEYKLIFSFVREDLPGFLFESNRGTKHSFTAETSLGKLSFIICYLDYGILCIKAYVP